MKTHVLSHVLAALAVLAVATQVHVQAQPASPAPVSNFEYDAQGNLTRIVRAPGLPGFGFTTTQTYDALGRPSSFTDARAGTTQLSHNARSELTQLTDPRSLVTAYQRDGLGQLTQLASPDTGVASQTFDAAGNLRTRVDARGVLATHSYDALNRSTSVVYSAAGAPSETYSWSYDQTGAGFSHGIGRLTSSSHPTGSEQFAYGALGRLTSARSTSDGVTLTTSYEYDAAGNVTALTYPSGRRLLISYVNGQATTISITLSAGGAASPIVSGIQWQPFGPVKSWQWHMATGMRAHERVFDTHGRVVRYPVGNLTRDLSYDAADRIASYTHFTAAGAAAPASNQSFAYDELGRLTGVTTTGWTWSAGYDANGNRTATALNGSGNVYTTASNSNRLLSVSNPSRSLEYDAAGNTVVDSGPTAMNATYTLDGRLGGLRSVSGSWRYGTSYSHTAGSQRMRKAVERDGLCTTGPLGKLLCPAMPTLLQLTRFVYDQAGHLLGEYDGGGQAIQEFIWLGDTPIAVSAADPANPANPSTVHHIHADHLDTPRHIIDRAGNTRWSWDAEPFGAAAPNENPSGFGAFTFNLRFPGQYFDVESKTHYNYFRNYDPSVGRYTQSDPIGLEGGINTYTYGESNPVSFTDPTGLVTWRGWARSIALGPFQHEVYFLASDCVCGVKVKVKVVVSYRGPGVGPSFRGFKFPGIAQQWYAKLSDPMACPSPSALAGPAISFGAGAAVRYGFNYSRTRLGLAESEGWDIVEGIGAAVGVGLGFASVEVLERTQCDDCKKP